MRKSFISWCIVIFLLTLPGIAGATLLGKGTLKIDWDFPSTQGYYLNYSGTATVSSDNFNYSINDEGIFCVSEEDAQSTEYVDFYEFDGSFSPDYDQVAYNQLARAAWIADHWKSYWEQYWPAGTYDDARAEAQKAIWEVMEIFGDNYDWLGDNNSNDLDWKLYTDSGNHSEGYKTPNWYYAAATDPNDQDYLTPNHTPEPATMLLFGSGLIGLATLRKKFLK